MSNIHNLEIDVDLKENLIITTTCKQLDDLNLTFNVWNNGEMVDLSEYKCRLKAFKQDQIPLIQNTSININNNIVNIIADEQFTTTSGIVKVELQFINKNTGKKKSTFNIIFKVMQSALEVERSISKATCTLLKEIDNKLDRIEDIGDVLKEAKEVRDTLTNKTIPTATNINSKLETNINNASTKITEVESIISSASNKIEEVETSINNADSSKKELDLSKTNADISKENLDTANTLAEKNIEELNSLGNVTDLAKNVQTNTTDIGTLKENVQTNTSQLKDLTNTRNLKTYIDISQLGLERSKVNSLGEIVRTIPNLSEIICEVSSFNSVFVATLPSPNGVLRITKISNGRNTIQLSRSDNGSDKNTDTLVYVTHYLDNYGDIADWKQLATTETWDLTLQNGWSVNYLLPKISKSGNLVTINLRIKGGVMTRGTQICAIHDNCIPYSDIFCEVISNITGQIVGSVVIEPNKKLSVYHDFKSNDDLIININYSL